MLMFCLRDFVLGHHTKDLPADSAEIWDALKAAAGADLATAQLLCDSAGIIIASSDLTTTYDERGRGQLSSWSHCCILVNVLVTVAGCSKLCGSASLTDGSLTVYEFS
jgi:hypothetical protein